MPAPKAKQEAKKKIKKQRTMYDENGHWTVHQNQGVMRQTESPLFEKYYRDFQKLTGEDASQFQAFMNTLRKPLETTLWINDTDPLASEVSAYFSKLPSTLVEPIPWYPYKGMAWRIKSDKVTFRKSLKMQELRQYIIKQTSMGTISRQEEVSMIPPFLLDIQEKDSCLDMCASPGSKTAQLLLELARYKKRGLDDPSCMFGYDYLSDGFVLANELDTSRANMLVHQVKRLRLLFPFALFSNHDARFFPELGCSENPVRFDKILCDVVCSGDGTIRKSPFMFKNWSSYEGLKLQKIQVQIALRAAHLLKLGGRMVYSTCTFNPIENEAVVSQIVHRTGGALKLIDASPILPSLRFNLGMKTWNVMDASGDLIKRGTEGFHEALFPLENPPKDFDLQKCMRLLPFHCNGGGFFIAVFEKVQDWDLTCLNSVVNSPALAEGEKIKSKLDSKSILQNVGGEIQETKKELRLPPQFVPPTASMLMAVNGFYDLADFPVNNLVVRTQPGAKNVSEDAHSNVYLVSNSVLRILQSKSDKVKIVSAGLRVLAYEHLYNGWRISYEASSLFRKYTEKHPKRLLVVPKALVVLMMNNGNLKDILLSRLPEGIKEQVEGMEAGTILLKILLEEKDNLDVVTAVALKARSRLQLLVDHEDLVELQLRMNVTDGEMSEISKAITREEDK